MVTQALETQALSEGNVWVERVLAALLLLECTEKKPKMNFADYAILILCFKKKKFTFAALLAR